MYLCLRIRRDTLQRHYLIVAHSATGQFHLVTVPIQFHGYTLGMSGARHALVDTQHQCDDNG